MEDGEYWFQEILPSGETLVISTISDKTAATADCDFCDGFGYYITLWPKKLSKEPPRVLAKMVDEEAAKDLFVIINGKLSKFEELERKNIRLGDTAQKFWDALDYYANEDNYWKISDGGKCHEMTNADQGKRARKAIDRDN